MQKTCKACGETKELTEFHRNPHCKLGVFPQCRLCRNTMLRTRYARPYTEAKRQQMQNWRDRNREHYRAYQRAYQAEYIKTHPRSR